MRAPAGGRVFCVTAGTIGLPAVRAYTRDFSQTTRRGSWLSFRVGLVSSNVCVSGMLICSLSKGLFDWLRLWLCPPGFLRQTDFRYPYLIALIDSPCPVSIEGFGWGPYSDNFGFCAWLNNNTRETGKRLFGPWFRFPLVVRIITRVL